MPRPKLSDEERKQRRREHESTPEFKAKHRAEASAYSKTPQAKLKRQIRESTPEARARINEISRKSYSKPEHKARQKKTFEERNAQVKLEVFAHYSKTISDSDIPICACCKYDDIRFLTLDHIEGRKNLSKEEQRRRSLSLWRYVKKMGLQKGYQVLCFNCNIAKGTRKYCLHQLDRM